MPSGIEVVFLGTGGSLPTRGRGLPSVAIRRDGELLLFDCGEGTQRQMMHAGLGFNRPTSIFISHLHGDHLLGLPGLLQTMSSLVRDKPLDIFGPKGLASFFKALHGALGFAAKFPVRVNEMSPGETVERSDYSVRTALAKHDITCLAYAMEEQDRPGHFYPNKARRLGIPEGPLWKELQYGKTVKVDGKAVEAKSVIGPRRPGLKVTYAIDTRPCQAVKQLAKESDLLMHDGGFALDRKEKAREYFHSTAEEAATLAKAAKCRRLALVHISAVTRDDRILQREARRVFSNTIVPTDLMVVSLKRSP
jgi:ribonuclease Z